MAKELVENGKVDEARQRLQEIIDRNPNSEAANEARKLLDNANH
jgi:TolA-binding protein